MAKYTEIYKSIFEKITTKFPAVKIVSESDVEEKIIRPSFMISLDEIKLSDFMNLSVDKSMTARVYYFSTTAEKNKLENLKTLEDLEEIFLENNQLKLPNFNISIEEHDVNFPDKVLEYSFEINFNQDYFRKEITENQEIIEELQIKNREE